jgi:hypothetical protein
MVYIYITIKINTIKVLNSESIVIIRIKGEHFLYSKISGWMIGYGWWNVCYEANFPPGEYLLYSKVSGGKVYYIANIPRGNVYYIVNIPGEGLLCGRFTIRHRYIDRLFFSCFLFSYLIDQITNRIKPTFLLLPLRPYVLFHSVLNELSEGHISTVPPMTHSILKTIILTDWLVLHIS